jgi:ATP-binding cassette subfamily B protein
MTSSPEASVVRPPEELPPAVSSIWRLCKLGFRHEPRLMSVSLGMALLAALPDALLALLLALLARGVLQRQGILVSVAAVGLAISVAATWLLRTVSTRVQRRFRDKVTIALEAHVAGLQASVATIAHQERPDYLDRLAMLRNQVFVLDHMYVSLFTFGGWILRLSVTLVLLASIHPALLLLAVLGLPPAFTSLWRPRIERIAQDAGAQAHRLAAHLFTVATTAAPGKEVRLTGIGDRLVGGRRELWERGHAPLARARAVSAAWHSLAWALFGAAYVGAIVFVAYGLEAPASAVLLVLAAGSRLSAYIGATMSELGFLTGFWMEGARRLAWLEDYAAAVSAAGDAEPPVRLARGISLQHVSFAYPGTERRVLEDISLELPAGAVVALVGENGAGKSTLVKLLTRMYEPTAGSIEIDGVPLSRMPAVAWRRRLTGAFQDFFRFELRARHAVGVGDVPRLDDVGAVQGAVSRAGAEEVVTRLAAGLDTQLGSGWPEGVDVSFGQWQRLALARGFMREEPLLLVLDEPTAALDAETEHALFERYAGASRRADTVPDKGSAGRITILVSHRFSTVRMADLIVVLDGARVAQVGSHEKLMEEGGAYAQLYGMQAAAYQ